MHVWAQQSGWALWAAEGGTVEPPWPGLTCFLLQRTPAVYCVRLARALVDDYCNLLPGSIQTLKQIFSASPRFCCQFITSVTALYDLSSGACFRAVALEVRSAI